MTLPYLATSGDICIMESPDKSTRRMVLILNVEWADSEGEQTVVHFTLLTNELNPDLECGLCGRDVFLHRDTIGTKFHLAAETDLTSIAWQSQLVSKVGHLSTSSKLFEVLKHQLPDLRPVRAFRGLPLRGPTDWRYAWKLEELNDLQALSSNCVSRWLDSI